MANPEVTKEIDLTARFNELRALVLQRHPLTRPDDEIARGDITEKQWERFAGSVFATANPDNIPLYKNNSYHLVTLWTRRTTIYGTALIGRYNGNSNRYRAFVSFWLKTDGSDPDTVQKHLLRSLKSKKKQPGITELEMYVKQLRHMALKAQSDRNQYWEQLPSPLNFTQELNRLLRTSGATFDVYEQATLTQNDLPGTLHREIMQLGATIPEMAPKERIARSLITRPVHVFGAAIPLENLYTLPDTLSFMPCPTSAV